MTPFCCILARRSAIFQDYFLFLPGLLAILKRRRVGLLLWLQYSLRSFFGMIKEWPMFWFLLFLFFVCVDLNPLSCCVRGNLLSRLIKTGFMSILTGFLEEFQELLIRAEKESQKCWRSAGKIGSHWLNFVSFCLNETFSSHSQSSSHQDFFFFLGILWAF